MGDAASLLPALAPAGGVFTLLAVVIIYLLKSDASVRSQARQSVAAEQKRADDAESRADAAEERERAAQRRLDEERELRRRAEDQYAEVLRELADLKRQVSRLETDLARFTATAGGT